MTRAIERLLHLRPGDLGRGSLLFFYHFFIISSFVVGQVVRDTLFLNRFQAEHLPYVDMTTTVLVLLVVTGYIHAGRYIGMRSLQAGSLLVSAVIAALFWWTTHFYTWPWLYPALYIWVGIYGVLLPAQMWILILSLLTTRARQLLGMVASGGIAGGILGGFLSSGIVQRFDTEHLLIVISLLLVMCAGLVVIVWRQWRPGQSEVEVPAQAASAESAWNLRESIRHIRASTLLQAIAVLICLSGIVTNIAGWQFKAVAAQTLLDKNELASFFGAFYGYTGIIGFLIGLFVAPRLLMFSVGIALFVLPVALVAGAGGVLAWGSLWAATLLKGSDKILRYSIEKPATVSLYFPVPPRIMMQAKMFIDTVIWRLGDGLAGLTVFIFATVLHLTIRQLSGINLLLLVAWFIVVFVVRRQYWAVLDENLRKRRLDAEQTTDSVLDRATVEVIAAQLRADDVNEILYALSLLDPAQCRIAHPALRDLLVHPAAGVREKALSILNVAGDTTVTPQVEQLLYDEHPGVRTEAMLYLAHHANVDPLVRIQELGDFPNFSIRSAIVTYLTRSGEPHNLVAARTILDEMVGDHGPEGVQTRLEALRLIGILPEQFEAPLEKLIHDPDPAVVRQAIRIAGALDTPRFMAPVLDRLGDPHMMDDAVEALGTFGDRVLDILRDHLFDTTAPIEMRREIPRVLMRIGTPTAKQILVDSLFESDSRLRSQIIASLNTLHQLYPASGVDDEVIETLLIAEIMGQYRTHQILGVLGQVLEHDDAMLQALRESMAQAMERIFRLTKLLYPQYDLHSAHFGVESENPAMRDNALEFLEHILKPELRDLLVPLLDTHLGPVERVRCADRLIGVAMETPAEALETLMDNPDPWLKSHAAYTIGMLGLSALAGNLDECLSHPDPLLRETAREAKARLTGSA